MSAPPSMVRMAGPAGAGEGHSGLSERTRLLAKRVQEAKSVKMDACEQYVGGGGCAGCVGVCVSGGWKAQGACNFGAGASARPTLPPVCPLPREARPILLYAAVHVQWSATRGTPAARRTARGVGA